MDPRSATLSTPAPAGETARVLCHGLVASDFLVRTPFPVPVDVKVRAERILRQGGGPAANAAVGLARLGTAVAFGGAVGDDALGRAQLDDLAREGVDVSAVAVIRGSPGFVSFILVDPAGGARTIFNDPDERPLAPEPGSGLPEPPPHLVLVDGWGGPAQIRVARLARHAGIPVVLDAGSFRPDVAALVPACEVVIASAPCADALAGPGRHEAALAALKEMGARLVAVTRGPRGAVASAAGTDAIFEVEAFAVDVVDTTGAGDAFHAGAAWALLRGDPWEKALRVGAAVAACKCRAPGARDGLPGPDAVRVLLGAS